MAKQAGIAFLGEPLLEIAATAPDQYALGVAGDVLNTAVAVAQLGVPSFLATAVGEAEQDQRFFDGASQFGVSTELMERDSNHQAGLYLINNSPAGERTFSYWRNDSAAKHLFASRHRLQLLLAKVQNLQSLYVSGITLSLLNETTRELFFDWVSHFRQSGGTLFYDNNYRARLWSSAQEYQSVNREMLKHTDIFLPSLEDVISSGEAGDECEARQLIRDSGVAEIIIKNGTRPMTVCEGEREYDIPVVAKASVVDTTGAGDGFNGGYLAARGAGLGVLEAAKVGMRVSAEVVCHKGAILPLPVWQNLKQELL